MSRNVCGIRKTWAHKDMPPSLSSPQDTVLILCTASRSVQHPVNIGYTRTCPLYLHILSDTVLHQWCSVQEYMSVWCAVNMRYTRTYALFSMSIRTQSCISSAQCPREYRVQQTLDTQECVPFTQMYPRTRSSSCCAQCPGVYCVQQT